MKFKILLSTLLCTLLILGGVIAQDQPSKGVKKATIVKKMIDEQGNETIKTIILEGDEVDAHLEKMKLETMNPEKDNIQRIEIIEDGDEANIWISKEGERINTNELIQSNSLETIDVFRFEEVEGQENIHSDNIEVEVENFGNEKIITITKDGIEKTIKVEGSDEHLIQGKDGEHKVIILNADFEDDDDNDAHDDEAKIKINATSTNTPFLGIIMNINVNHDDHGGGDVITTKIIRLEPVPNSPAEKAGIKAGDILFGLDDVVIEDIDDVTNLIKNKRIGDKVVAKIIRADKERSIPIILGERPKRNIKTYQRNHHHPAQKRKHRVKRDPCKPFIGVSSRRVRSDEGGLEILRVIDNTPAKREGLLPGDVILEMDGQKVNSQQELVAIRDRHDNGDRFKLLIQRNGTTKKVRSSFNDCPKDGGAVETEINIDQENVTEAFDVALNIFPNPTDGKFTLSYNGQPGTLNISISDITGKVLFEKTMSDYHGNYNEQIDLSEIADGTIVIRIENEGEVLIEKLILQSEN